MKQIRTDMDHNKRKHTTGPQPWLASKLTDNERRALVIVVSLFALGCLVRLCR